MASMWRRAMVYLGLQDDDELDYGGDYESYGEYGEPVDSSRDPRDGRGGRDGFRDAHELRDGGGREPSRDRTAQEPREATQDFGSMETPPPRPHESMWSSPKASTTRRKSVIASRRANR